jgi:hypothetical protein
MTDPGGRTDGAMQQSALEALAACLRGCPPPAPDWDAIVREANEHLVAPALGAALAAVPLPEDLSSYLRLVHGLNRERNACLRAQAIEAVGALNAIGIEPVLLKGAAILLDAPDERLGHRMLSDVDLAVPAERLHDALERLVGLGYEAIMEDVGDHAHAKLLRGRDAGTIDLHHRPPGPARLYDAAPPLAAELVVVDGCRMWRPNPTERAIHLIAHDMINDGCLVRGDVDLRHLLDLRDLVASGSVDWRVVRERLASPWLALALDVVLLNLRSLLDVEVPARGGAAAWLYRRQILRSRAGWFRAPNDLAARAALWVRRRAKRLRHLARTNPRSVPRSLNGGA